MVKVVLSLLTDDPLTLGASHPYRRESVDDLPCRRCPAHTGHDVFLDRQRRMTR